MTTATRISQICIFNENNSDICKLCTPRTCVFHFDTILSRPVKHRHEVTICSHLDDGSFAFHFLNFSSVHASLIFRKLMVILDSKQFPYVANNANLYFMDIFIVAMNYPLSTFVSNLSQDYLPYW